MWSLSNIRPIIFNLEMNLYHKYLSLDIIFFLFLTECCCIIYCILNLICALHSTKLWRNQLAFDDTLYVKILIFGGRWGILLSLVEHTLVLIILIIVFKELICDIPQWLAMLHLLCKSFIIILTSVIRPTCT